MMCIPRRPHGAPFHFVAVLLALALVAGTLLLMLARPVAAQGATRTAAIILTRGTDTIVVQRIQRSGSSVTGVTAGAGAPRITNDYTLGADHLVTRLVFSAQGANAPADAPPLQSGVLTLGGDTAHFVIRAGGSERVLRPATKRDVIPLGNNDFIPMEQAVRRARLLGVTTLTVPVLALANGQTYEATLELFAPDSARFSLMGNATVASVDAAGNITGGYLPGQNIRISVVTGAAAEGVSIGRVDYSAPPDAPYRSEDVTVTTPAGHVLTGTLTIPKNANGRVPAVVTITGSGQQDRDEFIPLVPGFRIFRQVADTLGRRGIAALRMDDRGIGGSGGDVNGTSADFADDIRAGVAFLHARAEIDPARIALIGHSEGGMIAPMVAATDPRLAAIVLMAGPAQSGRTIIDFQLRNGVMNDTTIPAAAKDSAFAAHLVQFDSTAARAPWMRYFLAHDPLPTIRRVQQPVLILQGGTDQQVTPEQAHALDAALRAAGNPRVRTVVFTDRNHLFLHDPSGFPGGYAMLTNGRVDGEVMGTLADWLATTLQRQP